jgi:predicted RND superfamily exporter protein
MNKLRWIWYGVILLVVVGAVAIAPEIPFQSNPDAYTLIPDEDRRELEAFQAEFESSGYPIIVMVLKNDRGWKSYEDYVWMDEATSWWHVNDTLQTLSITNVPFPVQTFLGIKKKNFVPLESKEQFEKWNAKAHLFNDITRKFLSNNRKYALLFVPAENYSEKRVGTFHTEMQKDGITLIPLDYEAIENELQATNQKETVLLASISFGLILLLFFMFTGSLRGLLFIFSMIAFSLSLTTLFIYFSDMWFSIHMVAIPCMLIVLSFTDLMHLLYTHHKVRGSVSTTRDLRKTLSKSLQRPMILTSLTNMIGFVLFLFLADSPTLTDISLLSIFGVFFAFLTSRFVAIQLLTANMRFLKEGTGNRWNQFHEKYTERWRSKRYALLGVTGAISVILAIVVWNKSTVNNVPFVTEGDHPSFEAASIMGDQFFGDKTGAIHFSYENAHDLWNEASMEYIEKLENRISELFPIKVFSSPTIVAKRYHRFQRKGHPGAYSYPLQYDSLFLKNTDLLGGENIIRDHKGKARMRFSFSNVDLDEALVSWHKLEAYIAENPPPKNLKASLSGAAYHNDLTTKSFSENILLGILISIIFGAVLTFAFVRNWTVFLATLLANSLPLLVALLIMILLGSDLNPISLFFFTVIMGLCVDDSIYLLLHRDKTSRGSIYPIAITSVVLAVGFAAFLFSGYDWVQPFGWAFLIGIMVAFLFDAFLLALFTDRNSTFDADV